MWREEASRQTNTGPRVFFRPNSLFSALLCVLFCCIFAFFSFVCQQSLQLAVGWLGTIRYAFFSSVVGVEGQHTHFTDTEGRCDLSFANNKSSHRARWRWLLPCRGASLSISRRLFHRSRHRNDRGGALSIIECDSISFLFFIRG